MTPCITIECCAEEIKPIKVPHIGREKRAVNDQLFTLWMVGLAYEHRLCVGIEGFAV